MKSLLLGIVLFHATHGPGREPDPAGLESAERYGDSTVEYWVTPATTGITGPAERPATDG
jgi:hypothetical protein